MDDHIITQYGQTPTYQCEVEGYQSLLYVTISAFEKHLRTHYADAQYRMYRLSPQNLITTTSKGSLLIRAFSIDLAG